MAAVDGARINDRIRAREVLLIGQNGEKLGVKPLPEALGIAREAKLDLVEVGTNSNPPVCKIMDYRRWQREQQARRAEENQPSTSGRGIREPTIPFVRTHLVDYLGGLPGVKASKGVVVKTKGVDILIRKGFLTVATIPVASVDGIEVVANPGGTTRGIGLATGPVFVGTAKTAPMPELRITTGNGVAVFTGGRTKYEDLVSQILPLKAYIESCRAADPLPVESAPADAKAAAGPTERSRADEIRKLGDLLRDGLLTPEEFAQEKQRILE